MFKDYRVEIKWAIYYSIFLLIWFVIEKIFGLHDERIALQQNVSFFILIPTVAFYVLEMVNKRKQFYSGRMTYFQGFITGIIYTVCIMILTPLVQFICYFIISPGYFKNLVDYSLSTGVYNNVQAAQQFTLGNFLFINEVFIMLTGVVFAAFIPLFLLSANNDNK